MRLLITDVTEMSTGNFCVAGWDVNQLRMVRPLPGGRNWTAALLAQYAVVPGALIEFSPTGVAHNSSYPHLTEDTQVDIMATITLNAPAANWFGQNAPPASASVAAAFYDNVMCNSIWNGRHQGAYVPIGAPIGSLGTVVLPRSNISFEEAFGKLKAVVNDGNVEYVLAVSSVVLKTAWRQGGLLAVSNALPASPFVHVRLGLARAFDQPLHKCYLMVNGIHG